MSDTKAVGAWSAFSSEINTEEKEVFSKVTEGLLGVDYQPVAVANQVVSGMNYRFFCNAKIIQAQNVGSSYAVLMEVYQPINNGPRITEIRKVRM